MNFSMKNGPLLIQAPDSMNLQWEKSFSSPEVFFKDKYWSWICIGALLASSLLFNVLFIAALTFLNPLDDAKMQSWIRKMTKTRIRHPLDGSALKALIW